MAKILLIDDNAELLACLTEVLLRQGHQVTPAANGNVALRLADQDQFDLVITDLIMPDREGVETIIMLRRRRPDQKVIAMSGGGRNSAQDYLMMARRLGAAEVLNKPFVPDAFLSAVNTVLRVPG